MTVAGALWLAWCAVAALTAVMGGLLHEATHAAAARLLGGRVAGFTREGWAIYTHWTPADGMTTLDVRLVQLAPALLGWAVGVVWVLRHGWPDLSPTAAVAVLGWAVYTIGGGASDYSLARAAAAYEQRDDRQDQEVAH